MTTPPLIMLAEGRKPRPRKATVIRPKEITLHMSVAKILREHCLPEWQWTHIASGELRDIRTASKLKRMGMRRGWPDFILVPPVGQLHCLELKRLGEDLTRDQENFQAWAIRNAIPYSVCRSIDETLAALDCWGCLRVRIGGV